MAAVRACCAAAVADFALGLSAAIGLSVGVGVGAGVLRVLRRAEVNAFSGRVAAALRVDGVLAQPAHRPRIVSATRLAKAA
jgi:hypothetical protein